MRHQPLSHLSSRRTRATPLMSGRSLHIVTAMKRNTYCSTLHIRRHSNCLAPEGRPKTLSNFLHFAYWSPVPVPLRPVCTIIMNYGARMYLGKALDVLKKIGHRQGSLPADEDSADSDSEETVPFSCQYKSFYLRTHALTVFLEESTGRRMCAYNRRAWYGDYTGASSS